MKTSDIPVSKRAGRGLQVLRELKSKPHRVFQAGPIYTSDENIGGEMDLFSAPVENEQVTLEIMSNTGEIREIDLVALPLSERTSNGSFVSETISEQGVLSAKMV